MEQNNNTAAPSLTAAQEQALSRKAKALSIGISTGKILGYIGAGVLMTLGVQKFKGRNDNDTTSASAQ